MTSGTYGQPSFGSSSSHAQTQSLVSRLHQKMGLDGSILFTLTWKERTTPSARSIFALRASVRRISDSDCFGWPTPMTPNGGRILSLDATISGKKKNGTKAQIGLESAARLTAWPTPLARNYNHPGDHGEGGKNLQTVALLPLPLRHWRTPTACSPNSLRGSGQDPGKRKAGGHAINLQDEVRLVDSGQMQNGSCVETKKTGQLNPAFSLWLMGYPTEWAHCAALVTRSSRKSRQS